MVSIGPSTQSNNFTHMFDIPDLHSCPSLPSDKQYCPNSIMDIINTNTDFTKFYYMVKLAKLEGVLNNKQANFTLFVPSDKAIAKLGESMFINMDSATARHIVKSSTLDKRITSELLQDSKASYFVTKDPVNKLFISNNYDNIYINNDIQVIQKDILLSNGIIHVIDGLINPIII